MQRQAEFCPWAMSHQPVVFPVHPSISALFLLPLILSWSNTHLPAVCKAPHTRSWCWALGLTLAVSQAHRPYRSASCIQMSMWNPVLTALSVQPSAQPLWILWPRLLSLSSCLSLEYHSDSFPPRSVVQAPVDSTWARRGRVRLNRKWVSSSKKIGYRWKLESWVTEGVQSCGPHAVDGSHKWQAERKSASDPDRSAALCGALRKNTVTAHTELAFPVILNSRSMIHLGF